MFFGRSNYRQTSFEMVREFHEVFGHPISKFPSVSVSQEMHDLRIELIREEFEELQQALNDRDVIEVADALGDLIYVVCGAALVYGIDLDAVVAEIHRSNMTKLDSMGHPIVRSDGKILKGDGYEPPQINKVLGLDQL